VAHKSGVHYYDLWHGAELTPTVANGKATLSFDLESLGFGAILATEDNPPSLRKFLSFMADRSRRPLASYSREWEFVPQTQVENAPTKPASSVPSGMEIGRASCRER